MNRVATPFQALMYRLAVLATLLMVCAPLLSRWQQSLPVLPTGDSLLCTTAGLRPLEATPLGQAAAHHSPGHHASSTSDAGDAHADDRQPHASHGFTCDYCLLAAHMLSTAAVALRLPALTHAASIAVPTAAAHPLATRWPAHAARGPPLPA